MLPFNIKYNYDNFLFHVQMAQTPDKANNNNDSDESDKESSDANKQNTYPSLHAVYYINFRVCCEVTILPSLPLYLYNEEVFSSPHKNGTPKRY